MAISGSVYDWHVHTVTLMIVPTSAPLRRRRFRTSGRAISYLALSWLADLRPHSVVNFLCIAATDLRNNCFRPGAIHTSRMCFTTLYLTNIFLFHRLGLPAAKGGMVGAEVAT